MATIKIPSKKELLKREKEQLYKEYKAMRLEVAAHVRYLISCADHLSIDDKLLLCLCDIENTLLSDSIKNREHS
ncbi:hypothetical protein [Cysteiniphilum marinum]|uniref:hypothetical protein n=1 Tax=Cysteiniphilum marinum TaxID=2774191 RepID=UPI00193B7727|nr:hypothetical protein [Cysteiniphilum marinum]